MQTNLVTALQQGNFLCEQQTAQITQHIEQQKRLRIPSDIAAQYSFC